MPSHAIGLVGPIASGKGTVAKLLRDRGYHPYSLSDRIREEIKTRNEEITRESLNRISNELRQNLGSDVLAKRTADLISQDNSDYVVVDAIRNPAEANFLKKTFNAHILGITASQEKRFEFFKSRGSNSAGIETFEQFKELDDREMAQSGEHKQQVGATLELADSIIENDGSISDLAQKLEVALAELLE